MEQLNKTQLVLLAFLISFVSSIATGIVTVTLMQQAPPAVSQGINRVVEKTIETVIPVKGPSFSETRIVNINQEELIVKAIDANLSSVVSLYAVTDRLTGVTESVGSGIIVSEDGIIVTDGSVAYLPDAGYFAKTQDGTSYDLTRAGDNKGIIFFKVQQKDKEKPVKFTSVSFGDSNQAKIGQFAISLGDSAATGIISSLSYDTGTTTAGAPKYVALIHTSTNSKDTPGSAVLSANGSFMGMVGIRSGTRVTIPANMLKDSLALAQAAR